MERQQIIESLRRIIPTESTEYNERLISLGESFLEWSKYKHNLKATEELCRPYMAAHLACEL